MERKGKKVNEGERMARRI